MRRRAHAVVEYALGRDLREIDPALAQEPLFVGQLALRERLTQGFDPGGVLVEDEYLGHDRFPFGHDATSKRRPAEGTRNSMLVNVGAIGWPSALYGEIYLHSGIGRNGGHL